VDKVQKIATFLCENYVGEIAVRLRINENDWEPRQREFLVQAFCFITRSNLIKFLKNKGVGKMSLAANHFNLSLLKSQCIHRILFLDYIIILIINFVCQRTAKLSV
jgi:hypothetical protein